MASEREERKFANQNRPFSEALQLKYYTSNIQPVFWYNSLSEMPTPQLLKAGDFLYVSTVILLTFIKSIYIVPQGSNMYTVRIKTTLYI